MKILGEGNLVWARKVVLEIDFDVMRIQWQQRMDSSCSYCAPNKSNFVPCSTYILVGVLDNLGLFSEVNVTSHFLIYCTLKNMQHWLYYSKALVLEANPLKNMYQLISVELKGSKYTYEFEYVMSKLRKRKALILS